MATGKGATVVVVVGTALSLGAVGVVGAARPPWLRHWFALDAAWWTFVVAVLTLIVTAVIPVALYLVARTGARARAAVQEQQKELLAQQAAILSAQRLDKLTEQAATLTGRDDLAGVLTEARKLDQGGALARIKEAYWANPNVPLSGGSEPVDARAVRVMSHHLASKLTSQPSYQALEELAAFTRLAQRHQIPTAGPVTDWLVERYARGVGLDDTSLREFLRDAQDDKLFASLLYAVREAVSSASGKVHIVAGVSSAYLDRIKHFPRGNNDTIEEVEFALSRDVLRAMTALLHQRSLSGLGRWPSEDMVIPPDGAAALVAATCGAASFTDGHLTMRCLEKIPAMMAGQARLGLFDAELRFAQQKFQQHQPALLARYPLPW